MATTKKKPSAAQLAARRLFAARAKAGTLRKGTKAKKRKANPVSRATAADSRSASSALKLRAAPKRKANPATRPPVAYAVHRATAHGEPGPLVAKIVDKAEAIKFARDWATRHKARAVVVGKAAS